ncbi:MAG: PilZ domain-containing protein [Desulfobulbus sp.]|nr:PilZ domain-containing protein [Desulfobulbus sp.]
MKNETFTFSGKYTGTLVDISKGGLAIQCAVFENDPVFSTHIDIFDAKSRFFLSELPFSVVGEVQPVPASAFSLLMIKRFSMQFGPLTSEQVTQVERFITEHTIVDS